MVRRLLRFRHPLAFSFRLLALLLLVCFLLYMLYAWHAVKQERLAQLAQISDFTARASAQFFDRYASAEYLLSRELQADGVRGDGPRMRAALQEFLRASPDLAAVSIILPDGHIWLSTALPAGLSRGPSLRTIMAIWNAPQAAFSGHTVVISRPHLGLLVKRWIMPILFPVRDAAGQLKYVISANVLLSNQQALWRYVSLPDRAIIGLMRDDGYLQSCWPQPEDSARLYRHVKNGPLVQALRRRPEARQGEFSGHIGGGSSSRIGRYTRVPGYPLVAFVAQPREAILASWYRQIRIPLAIFVLLISGGFFIYRRAIGLERELEQSQRQTEAQLAYMAHHDTLTGLPNRNLFRDRLLQALERARRDGRMLALLFMDLDGFKDVNDRFGHAFGDLLLRQVVARLRPCLRGSDTLARLGGDEFTVILEDIGQAGDAAAFAQRILAALAQPFMLENESVAVSSSIGIALFPSDAVDGDGLIAQADAAMYRAKHAGGSLFCFHTTGQDWRFGGEDGQDSARHTGA